MTLIRWLLRVRFRGPDLVLFVYVWDLWSDGQFLQAAALWTAGLFVIEVVVALVMLTGNGGGE
jgi:hypothetical protein